MALNFLKSKTPDTSGPQSSADASAGERQRLPTPAIVKESQTGRGASLRSEPTVVDLVPEDLRDEFAGLLDGFEADIKAVLAEERQTAPQQEKKFYESRAIPDFKVMDALNEARMAPQPVAPQPIAPQPIDPQPVAAKPVPASPAAAPSAAGVLSAQGDDPLLREAQSVLAALEPAMPDAVDPLLSQIEALAVQMDRERTELEAARGTAELLSAENIRLNEENKRLRGIMRTLINAVDGDRRRHIDQLGKAERRLRDLTRRPGETD